MRIWHRLVLADIVGTIGYVDPTYEKTGFVTHKSDVYSFGVVLFEVLCGRRAFVPDEGEKHPPQYFIEQDYKDAKLDVMGKLVGIESDSHCPPIVGYGQPSNTDMIWSDEVEEQSSILSVMSFQRQANQQRFVDEKLSLFFDRLSSSSDDYSSSFADSPPSKRHRQPLSPLNLKDTKKKRFRLQPLFTMKRLDQYMHSPNEEILAQLAKSHYEEESLDDIIDPDLRRQMDPKSFKIFSETSYNCLKDKRAERPNIDQILINLQEALRLQIKRENNHDSTVAGEAEGTTSNRWKVGHLQHLKIPLIDLEVATKNFTETYLGEGAFAKVYRAELEVPIEDKITGEISRKWRTVAIKCITKLNEQGRDGFHAEIELLTSCNHTNIVGLLGFCDEGSNMILVYEHASNRSLDRYMGGTHSSTNLTWVQRIKIGIDIARGLNYIHNLVEDEQRRIIHRDIKSENILLGKNWVAKIADFGLSRFHIADKKDKTIYTVNIAGTECYLCPDYQKNGKLKTAIDIYSFGVVLFEILSGKLAYDQIYLEEDKNGIAYVARRRFKEKTIHEIVDPKIMEEVDESTFIIHKGPNQDSLKKYTEVAHRCVAITQDARPTAKDVLEELMKALFLQENSKDHLQMSFEEIKVATQNFCPENRIGGGGFGKVFKGKVTRDNGSTAIVAKRLDKKQGRREHQFLMELEILFEYKHENIIGLEGYCNENDEKIIVYEPGSNASLDRHLDNIDLTWTKRLNICIDIARGLAFLHGGAATKEVVIHRDIKSANILLVADWKAKISDFGLSVITAINQPVNSLVVGTIGYVDPQSEENGFFTEKSDIYSLGVVLFEILYGKLLVPTKNYDQQGVASILAQVHRKGELGSIIFKGIKEQIDPESLSIFREIVSQCLAYERTKRPTAEHVLQELNKSLEFQEDFEIWKPKLPKDYEDIFKLSKSPGISYSVEKKKKLYCLLSKGLLLQDDKVWFSLGSNGERNEMISATTFSYRNNSPHDNWCIVPESRFQKVAKMLDISNLMIEIKITTQFLSPNTVYGVYLVFKFCDATNVSKIPMHVDLKYRNQSRNMHAYFAKWRDDEWMMIEFHRFLNQKKDVVNFKFLLESLSHCRDDAIYVEGIEFRPVDDVGHDETKNSKEIQVMKSNSNVDPIQSGGIFKISENYDQDEKLYALSEVNGKKHLMLSAKTTLHNFSNSKLFSSRRLLAESRFEEGFELLSQPLLRISYMIKSQMLSQDTNMLGEDVTL
ncbi:hypothetical protein QVD17_00374 [Tagetes erecta]|uniref:non-specific serine/threonine protein kinase n=1 Tax=Tagetes erecta TaxID=13708 RepID=A0AAD8P7B8_TARER|nr:hypothetical protein QVD17_00374 [Tagetes erecta]